MAEEKVQMPIVAIVSSLVKRWNEKTLPKIEAWRRRLPVRVTEEAEEAKEEEEEAEEELEESSFVRYPKALIAVGESKLL